MERFASLWKQSPLWRDNHNHFTGETITSLGRQSVLLQRCLLDSGNNHNHFTGDLVGRQSLQWGDNCITGMEEIDAGGGLITFGFF